MFSSSRRLRSQVSGLRLVLIYAILLLASSLQLAACSGVFGQENEPEITLDVTSSTVPLSTIFKPNIDLSGRGFHQDVTWPQTTAAGEVLDIWQRDVGFGGLYRLQYNLWEISQLSKDKDLQNKLRANYEDTIKRISDAGGIVILDIFGTPAGLGKVLDKKSAPRDLKALKALIKNTIRELSCNKRYNIWYEVWNAPDLENFFLGREQEYLNLYKAIADSIIELRRETKIHIPLGGPSVSSWFNNLDGNTIVTPEKSLIYDLIKFCYRYRLPLDFISWHSYSSSPETEKEITVYKKTAIGLMRDWLSYFDFDKDTPLIVDEWNFDKDANVLPERKENSFICASYIPSRIKNMYEAGLNYQVYFCLEDFQDNKEGLVRNVGIFSFLQDNSGYKGGPKSIYNVFRMLKYLGDEMFTLKLDDTFVGAIATKAKDSDSLVILIYNYLDPNIVTNYLSRNIADLNGSERKILLNIIKSDKLEKIMLRQLEISGLRATNKVKGILKKGQELNDKAKKFSFSGRNFKINIKNLKDDYIYQRYTIDSSCSLDCAFSPVEEKQVSATELYQESLTLNPYSVHMILLKKKPKEPVSTPAETKEQQPGEAAPSVEKPKVESPPTEKQEVVQPPTEKPAVEQLPAEKTKEQPILEKTKEQPPTEKPAVEQPVNKQEPNDKPATQDANNPS